MSYDLLNQSLAIQRTFSRQTWKKALELALLYGWQAKGTESPPIDLHELNAEWDGRYYTNDGQTVNREDAFLLAAALEKAVKDIPDETPKIDWNTEAYLDDGLPEELTPEEREEVEEGLKDGLLDIMGKNPLEYFAGDEKQHLIRFIKFCRLGRFEIL